MSLSIKGSAGTKMPAAFFVSAAEKILPKWELSLAFVDSKTAKDLNIRLRGKDYIPNVLSYEVGKKSGEVIICPAEAKRQAPSYHLPPTTFILFLFIHGCLHLKGERHGATMERTERKLLDACLSSASPLKNGTKNRNGNRHRHASS